MVGVGLYEGRYLVGMAQDVHRAPFRRKKARDPFGKQAWSGIKSWSGHRADRRAQMAHKARPMAITVIALRLRDRTVTQTDIAPSWISAVAMAPAVIEARKGMSMGLLSESGWWEMKSALGLLRGRLGGLYFGYNLVGSYILQVSFDWPQKTIRMPNRPALGYRHPSMPEKEPAALRSFL